MYDSTCGAAASGQCGPAQRDGDVPPAREPPAPLPADYSGFDIVKATQYGAIARVKELVEAGADVNRPDRETVTLLHWAAINNRRELVEYLLQCGAHVDAVGGELQATPLQWAARQGHLEAVVALVRAGADPALRDAEGCASLHLAAQFGHTAVVAYLVARGVAPDEPDAAGMTALMWACWKVAAVDPTRLLLTLGASTAPADTAHGNTALHWAVLARNATAVSTLLLYGSASLEAGNLRGVTPLGMLQAAGAGAGGAWLPVRVRELVRARSLPARVRYVPARLARDPAVRRAAVVALPFLAFYLTGLVLEADAPYALKALLLLALYGALHVLAGALLDDELRNVLPLSVYLSTKAWFYMTWVVFVAGAVPAAATAGYLAASLLLWWGFVRSWRADPGVISASRADRLRTIRELAEAGGAAAFEPARFCSACLVRRPLRSKHCAVCNRCVARFDHHCPWVNNCIGERNHRHFVAFLGALLLMCAWTLWGCARYLAAACGAPLAWPRCGAWVTWVAANAAFHLFWVLVLTCCQLYLVVCLGMTTNEQLNRGRYRHFQARGGRSPFSRGPLRNAADFFRCRLCGLLPPPRADAADAPDADAADADDAPMLPHHFV